MLFNRLSGKFARVLKLSSGREGCFRDSKPSICLSHKALDCKTAQEEGWGIANLILLRGGLERQKGKQKAYKVGKEDETLNHKSEQKSTPVRQSKRREDSAVVGKPL